MQKPVETAEITVQYVNPPKEGKKWGNIKSTAGEAYFGPPSMLSRYQPGETCKIEYELGGTDGTLKSLKRKIDVPQALQRPTPPPMRGRTNPTDSEQIFVCALLKELVSRDDTVTDVIARVNLLRDVYRNTFGGQRQDDQMRDEIQF
jgi:hypothetical protein